jgi:CRISPR type IV-associated protein Csf3
MQPLKITVTLRTGMVLPEQHLHLDALLGSLRVRYAKKEHGEGINPRDYHYDIPVDRFIASSGEWVFKASAFKLVDRHHKAVWMQTGRVNLEEAARHRSEGWLNLRANKPITAGGPFKTSLYHLPLVWGSLEAYCVGDATGVQNLLSECHQIGGRRGVGMGQVQSITVEPISADDCDWQYRAMPADTPNLGKTHALAVAGIRAPYWDRRSHLSALVPI